MIILDETLISDEICTEFFCCDLKVCKGGCCVYGDAGAPLDKEESKILDELYPEIKPFMRPDGIAEIEKSGTFVNDPEGDLSTPLINGLECAYVVFDAGKIAGCAIEKAWEAKKIEFQKPLSCHLYPIRIKKYSCYEAINYHTWPICDPARMLGRKLNMRVFEFLKEPLIRKYGHAWYNQLTGYIKQFYRQDLNV